MPFAPLIALVAIVGTLIATALLPAFGASRGRKFLPDAVRDFRKRKPEHRRETR